MDADLLIRYPTFPSVKWHQHSHISNQRLAKIYEEAKPLKPMSRNGQNNSDPVMRHGLQMCEMLRHAKKGNRVVKIIIII